MGSAYWDPLHGRLPGGQGAYPSRWGGREVKVHAGYGGAGFEETKNEPAPGWVAG
jgi:hypothetical protein